MHASNDSSPTATFTEQGRAPPFAPLDDVTVVLHACENGRGGMARQRFNVIAEHGYTTEQVMGRFQARWTERRTWVQPSTPEPVNAAEGVRFVRFTRTLVLLLLGRSSRTGYIARPAGSTRR